jgi:hypothetical protein
MKKGNRVGDEEESERYAGRNPSFYRFLRESDMIYIFSFP